MNDDPLYLLDIAAALHKIEQLVAIGQAGFMQSWLLQDAAMRNFEIIGEAAKHLSPLLKTTYPDVPWRQIAGLRDVLIHDYRRVNLDTIWRIMEHDLSLFKQHLQAILVDYHLPSIDQP